MPTTTEGAAPAASSETVSAPTFADEIGEFFGDYRSEGGESPDPETTSAAGTTPAEPATGTEPTAPDATAAAATASEETTSGAPTAASDQDPFADSTPATFMVNGVPVTNEDIRVFKEGGAVIRPEALPDVLNKLSERESLFERNRAQSHEYQTLAKVIEWSDPSSGKTLSGPDAAIEMRIANAAMFAENNLLVEALTNPDKLVALLATEQVPDGKGGLRERVVLNPEALAYLQRENALQQRELAAKIRDHYKTVVASAAAPAAPVNYATEALKLTAKVAEAAKLDASVLTAQDKALFGKQLPFHIKDGKVSFEWQELVKDRIQDRIQQKATTQSVVSATEKAAKEGNARMAAAARGVRPATKPAATAPAKPATTQSAARQQNEGDAFDAMLGAAAGAMRSTR